MQSHPTTINLYGTLFPQFDALILHLIGWIFLHFDSLNIAFEKDKATYDAAEDPSIQFVWK